MIGRISFSNVSMATAFINFFLANFDPAIKELNYY